eukprot:1683350-Pleurochrysis_carterae.AAC.1
MGMGVLTPFSQGPVTVVVTRPTYKQARVPGQRAAREEGQVEGKGRGAGGGPPSAVEWRPMPPASSSRRRRSCDRCNARSRNAPKREGGKKSAKRA